QKHGARREHVAVPVGQRHRLAPIVQSGDGGESGPQVNAYEFACVGRHERLLFFDFGSPGHAHVDCNGLAGLTEQSPGCRARRPSQVEGQSFLFVGRTITRLPLGPGTAPLTRSTWRSASTRTTWRLRTVTRSWP